MDALSLMEQLSFNIFQAYKPNPKTWEMYFDTEASTKAMQVAVKMAKLVDKEPEVVQHVFLWTGGRAG